MHGEQFITSWFFELYFTQEIVELLVTETNQFASQFFVKNAYEIDDCYSGQWTDVSKHYWNENIHCIKAFDGGSL